MAWHYLQLVKSMFSWVRCSSVFENYAGSSLAAGRPPVLDFQWEARAKRDTLALYIEGWA